jgi:HEAT repeat protein
VSQGDTTLTLTNGSATLQPVSVYRVAAIQPASDGKVTVIYDGVERHTAEGSAQNPEIQRLLLNALQNPPNSGVRLDSIDALRAQVSDDDVRQTMLWVLQHDPNPGVRLKALESLRASVRDNASVREAMVHALMNDSFPGVRAQAIDALTQAPPQDASRLLQQVARTTANANVRLRCAYALKQMQAPVPRGILPPTLDEDEK